MKAAIIGGGVIGGGWAARFLLSGWDVAIHDPDPEAERKIGTVIVNARRALPMLYDRALPAEGTLTFCDSLDDAVRGADWVQESVPERLDLKRRILAAIEAAACPDTLIASSTSGFKPSDLREGARHPGRILVAHPFNPVYLLPLVELVPAGPEADRAAETLRALGMFPLPLAAEIDAHVADRLLEAVWREALWLVNDDIATTTEIDEAIRMGFGLRWAQMGLFETYRIAGGEAGMAHFLAQFGPALEWPWTKLMDVPELSDDLVAKIAAQSDAQAAGASVRELERRRDDNLVSILRALKARGQGAGAVLAEYEASLSRPADHRVTVRRTIPVDWTDYNGHMNESRYGQVFSNASDVVLAAIGAGPDYVARGLSFFTVETHTRFLSETHAGDLIECLTRVTEAEGKKLGLSHEMVRVSDGVRLATCDQLLIHVSLETRRSAPPAPEVAEAMGRLRAG